MSKTKERPSEREPSAFSEQKIASIVIAAHALFTKHGYGATSMDAVAAEAGVGKATVYAHFKSKTELFAAVIISESDFRLSPIRKSDGESLGTALGRFATEIFALIMRPTNTAVFRVIAAEAGRFPDLGNVFYQSGPAALQVHLAATLRRAMELGELRHGDAHIMACQFLALICGDLQLRELVGLGVTIAPQHRVAVVKSGLETFFRAFGLNDVEAAIKDAHKASKGASKQRLLSN